MTKLRILLLLFLGTGKTYTGIKLLYLFDQINEKLSKEGKPRKQVLFCGPSNKSVDLVASEYFIQYSFMVICINCLARYKLKSIANSFTNKCTCILYSLTNAVVHCFCTVRTSDTVFRAYKQFNVWQGKQ